MTPKQAVAQSISNRAGAPPVKIDANPKKKVIGLSAKERIMAIIKKKISKQGPARRVN